MTIKSADRKKALLAELEEEDMAGLTRTMDILDNYTVTPPSAAATDHLLALLTPTLDEELARKVTIEKEAGLGAAEKLQLALSQTRLLSWRFLAASMLFFLSGLSLTTALDGNTLRFMANASPLLGILTILYQFRASYNYMSELEAACPYTPAQLAAAKLLVVLCYDVLLGLAATPFISYGDYVVWQIVLHWLAPLLLTLGIALFASLQLGISGGCLLSTAAWALNLTMTKDGKTFFSYLLPQIPMFFLDFLIAALGLGLLAFSFSRLNTSPAWESENQHT